MLFPCVHGFHQWTPRSSVSPKHADFDWSYHISGLAMDWSTVQTVSCPDKYWDWLQLQLQSKERPSCRRTVVQTKVRVTNLQLLGPVEQNMAFIWGSMRSGFVRFLQIQTHIHGECVCVWLNWSIRSTVGGYLSLIQSLRSAEKELRLCCLHWPSDWLTATATVLLWVINWLTNWTSFLAVFQQTVRVN